MIRKLVAAAFVAAAVLSVAPAASAAQQPGTPTPRAPHPRVAPAAVAPLCVTTTWRAKHTHRPKTRPGQVCILTPGMWLPRSWRVLVVTTVGDGVPFLVVQRPR